MLKRAALLIGVSALIGVAALMHPHAAKAWLPHGTPSPNCPFGSSFPDGCAGSSGLWNASQEYPSGTTTFAAYVTGTASGQIGSGQHWTSPHPQPWNIACVDVGYYCGPRQTLVASLDPAPAGVIAPALASQGCTYSATQGTGGGPGVKCNNGTNLSIVGYNWMTGSQGCVTLEIVENQTGTLTVTDNYIGPETGCPTATLTQFDTGGGASQGTYNLVWSHNLLDGHARSTDTACSGGPCTNGGGVFDERKSGTRTAQYNVMLYTANRPWTGANQGSSAALTNAAYWQWNYGEGLNYLGTAGNHSDGFIEDATNISGAATVAVHEYDYNTIVTAASTVLNAGTALIYFSNGSNSGTMTWTASNATGNTLINNLGAGSGTINSANVEVAHTNTFTQVTFVNNFLDVTGSQFPFAATTSPTCTNPTSWSGNTSLTTGATISSYAQNQSVGGSC